MSALENKIPPLIVLALFALLMWVISTSTPSISIYDVVHLSATALVIILGAFFCIAGVLSFKRAKTTVDPRKPEAASALVDTGIYRISRNPMYVGFALFLVAWALYLESLWSLVGVPGFIFYINHFQIAPEECALTKLFGDEFTKYTAKVRRWL